MLRLLPSSTLFPYTTLFRSRLSLRIEGPSGWVAFAGTLRRRWLTASRWILLQLQRRRTKERSEEHTSELQSLTNLVCRLLLEKKKGSAITIRLNSVQDSVST